MKILFVHQNFPGQFKFLAPALAAQGHEVLAMTMQKIEANSWQGVKLLSYSAARGSTPNVHPWLSDIEAQTIRGEACFKAAQLLKQTGFNPDVIVAHHGWGESLFLKEVWPAAKLGIYCEFYYKADEADANFDPEFSKKNDSESCRIRLKNVNNLLHFAIADAGISPTHWQASTFPNDFKPKISVIHDGIDTKKLIPNPEVAISLNNKLRSTELNLSKKDEVITFVNRHLEPYRGYHIFMRALPVILKARPNAKVLIVGGDSVSYGQKAASGKSWKEIFIAEVRPAISDADWQRVRFLGHIPYEGFISLLQLSSVHVYLTYPFVLSWSLLEAMSVGCAIVASNTQPLHEAIIHDKTGRLVDFFDHQALAQEVIKLLANAKLRKKLGKNARAFAIEHYDLQTICLPRQLSWVQQLAASSAQLKDNKN